MNFFDQVGKMALGSRMRLLTEKITEDAAAIYKMYGVPLQPKWFPVFYALSKGEKKTITHIAKEIGHSHPSVSKIIGEMIRDGLVIENADESDGRRNPVSLSKKGHLLTKKIQNQYQDVDAAVEELSVQATHDLWKAIGEWEFLLDQKSLLRRVQEKQRDRERMHIEIVPFRKKYENDFRSLNEEWISTYFKMEDEDYKALNDPQSHIIKPGGAIMVALHEGRPVGVCALLKMVDAAYDFELAKMAVSPAARGKHVGLMLGQAALRKAKELGAKSLYLESNTLLKPAINLYQKLGFRKVKSHATPYERCNIQMAVTLHPDK